MKKIAISSFLLFAILFEACKKETEQGIKKVEMDESVGRGEEYRIGLREYIHDGEFALITRPPDNYRVSRILYTDPATGPVYQYISDLPTGSTDKVIIKIIREHEHDPLAADDHQAKDDYTSVIITINFLLR